MGRTRTTIAMVIALITLATGASGCARSYFESGTVIGRPVEALPDARGPS
jgi:hypothetical protein